MSDKQFDKQIGALLKEAREKAKMTQQEVAERLGITKAAISNYETGYRVISAKALKDYCKAVGVSVDEVFKRI